MPLNHNKPYVLRVAELIYSKIVNIKKENSGITNIQAFEIFMTAKDYDLISSGEFHNQWLLYYAKSHFPLEISQRAFDHLWRVCESYEMWCKETKQNKLITLNILD